MRSGLQCDTAPRHRSEDLFYRLGRRAQPLLHQDVTCFIEHAIKARPVAQIQTDGRCRSCLLSVSCIIVVVSFFIAGLLVSRASSASITWELNASRSRPAFSSHLLSPTATQLPVCP